jgi:bifunctional DNase/RNase
MQVENVAPARPMTHDLMRSLLRELDVELVRVLITDLRESTFFAYLELKRGSEVLFVDARPSDALALAIRAKAPVFVEQKVLEQAKSVEPASEQGDQERLQKWLESLDPDDLGYKM